MSHSRNKRRRRIAKGQHLPKPPQEGYAAFWAGVERRREALIEAALARMAEIKAEKRAKREARDA